MTALPVLTSALLDVPGVRHAFFTRQGGVSQGVYEGLNVGVGSRDDPGRVMQNRRRAAAHFGAQPPSLVTAYQIHSTIAVTVEGPWPDRAQEGDAVVTATPGVICGALAADCAPVLIADPKAKIVAAVHAGWKGALGGVIEAAVARMVELGASAADMTAAVGPCIGPASYEVGLEFLESFVAADPANAAFFAPGASDDKRLFDLPAFVLARLKSAGVGTSEWLGADTCAEPDRFFSNRRAFKQGEGDYGRLLSAIMLV